MNTKKSISLFIVFCLTAIMLTSCGGSSDASEYNELTFSLSGIKELIISYDDEDVSFFESDRDELVIREYMSEDKESYHAEVVEEDGTIKISEGGKPLFKGDFTRYIEVYLPAAYSQSLKVTTTDGDIDMSHIELDMDNIRVDCTSGTFRLNKATAGKIYFSSTSGRLDLGSVKGGSIKIETTDGEVSCEKAEGKVKYTSTSGTGEFLSVIGSGSYRAENSGKLSVRYDEVTGDLSFFNKNDNVQVKLPKDLSFEFEAVTKNGSIDTNFGEGISVDGSSAKGVVGENPQVKVKAETRNGNIEVNK